jgi:hypothetical protein
MKCDRFATSQHFKFAQELANDLLGRFVVAFIQSVYDDKIGAS